MGIDWHYDSPEDIFAEIRTVVPQYAGMTYERLGTQGLQWPCPTEDHPGTPFLHQGQFTRGKGLLQGIPFQQPAELVDDEYPMLLTTGRMLYHYNIMTRLSQNLEWLRPYELAELNPADAARLGVVEDELVRVTSRRGSITTRVTLTDKVPPGTMFMTFHFKESPVNELTNAEGDPVTMTAEFKVCAVRMEKEPAAAESRGSRGEVGAGAPRRGADERASGRPGRCAPRPPVVVSRVGRRFRRRRAPRPAARTRRRRSTSGRGGRGRRRPRRGTCGSAP